MSARVRSTVSPMKLVTDGATRAQRILRPDLPSAICYEETASSRDKPETSRNDNGAPAMRLQVFG
jgi:hypothetical protein